VCTCVLIIRLVVLNNLLFSSVIFYICIDAVKQISFHIIVYNIRSTSIIIIDKFIMVGCYVSGRVILLVRECNWDPFSLAKIL